MGNKGSKKKEPKVTPETYDYKKAKEEDRIMGLDIKPVLERMGIENMMSLPPQIQTLLDHVEENISTKEVFKRDGSKADCNKLTYMIDKNEVKLEGLSTHVVVAVVKKYMRELPGGLLPYDVFAPLGDIEDQEELVGKMAEEIPKIDESRQFFYFHVARLLNMAMNNEENAMGITDLTQVFRMNLMALGDPTQAAKFTERAKRICDATILKFDAVFPEPDKYKKE